MKFGIVLLVIGSIALWVSITVIQVGFEAQEKNWGAVFTIVTFWGMVFIPCLSIGIWRLFRHFKSHKRTER